MLELPPSFSEAFLRSEDFLLPCCILVDGKKARTFSGRRPVSYILDRCNVMGVVSRIGSKNFLNDFSLKARDLLTREVVWATCQAKLSTLVKTVRRYNVPFPRSQMLQTHRQTDTQDTSIIIIDNKKMVN